jgi:hypothetical protein
MRRYAMTIFHFGRHTVPFADIHDIHLEYNYHNNEIFVDLEVNGGVQMSLNLPDSIIFMEQFINKIKQEKAL